MIDHSVVLKAKEAACHAWGPLCVGDWATWAGAIASVIVAVIALGGMLKDAWRYARERRSRARLVAAYLATPFGRIFTLLQQAREPLRKYAAVLPGSASSDVSSEARRLEGVYSLVSPLLEKFNIADAASLPDGIGEKLADAVGEIHMVLDLLKQSVEAYFAASGANTAQTGAAQRRFEAAKNSAFLVPMLDKAIADLNVFVDFCNREFQQV